LCALQQIRHKNSACTLALAFKGILAILSSLINTKGVTLSNVENILGSAQARGAQNNLSYAGALTPEETYQLVNEGQAVVLVDVRSRAELELVGRVPLATHIEWAFYPGMVANPDFAAQLQAQVDKQSTIVFMCRTGGRSHNAALLAQQLGYGKAYNMLQGFEGDANEHKQRTLINGWKHAGLPWTN
jgi:rhodanese-related sulfurtransferase